MSTLQAGKPSCVCLKTEQRLPILQAPEKCIRQNLLTGKAICMFSATGRPGSRSTAPAETWKFWNSGVIHKRCWFAPNFERKELCETKIAHAKRKAVPGTVIVKLVGVITLPQSANDRYTVRENRRSQIPHRWDPPFGGK